MDFLQEGHERAVGNAFIGWFNNRSSTNYQFASRAGEAPDLIYRDGNREMRLEITTAWYDAAAAKYEWQNARGSPNAPEDWEGVDPDQNLIESVNEILRKKCSASYGSNCSLVVEVLPRLTTAEELQALLGNIAIPRDSPFAGIYLTDRSDGASRYHCWKLA